MRNFKFFSFFIFIAFLSSCSKEDQPDISDQVNLDTAIETRHYTLGNWTPKACADFSVFVFGDCGPNWTSSVVPAIEAYNDLGLAINFVMAPNAVVADLVIQCVDMGGSFDKYIGVGEWPNLNGKIGGQIFLNTDYEDICDDPCFYQGITMHEIGHNLGFEHNESIAGDLIAVGPWTFHPETGEFTKDNPIPSTVTVHIHGTATGNDPGSIYNEGSAPCTNTDCTFSDDDITALSSLYPLNGPCNLDPFILGLDNLCINQIGKFCIPIEYDCGVEWFGHPDINGSTERCVSFSFDNNGTDFIYADIQIGNCEYFVSKKINIGAPDILEDLTVEIDPCDHVVRIEGGDPNTLYDWGAFNFSYNASLYITENNSAVTVRTFLKPGQEFCFNVQATNECGTSYLPCDVCYTIPDCGVKGFGKYDSFIKAVAVPNNGCSSSQCPDGYSCQSGICCDEVVMQSMCVTNDQCPPGFTCVFGDCCFNATGECL